MSSSNRMQIDVFVHPLGRVCSRAHHSLLCRFLLSSTHYHINSFGGIATGHSRLFFVKTDRLSCFGPLAIDYRGREDLSNENLI